MTTVTIPKVYLRSNAANSLDIQCGVTLSLGDNMSASVSVTPIVTYDANNSFAYDISANKTYSLNFVRNQPENAIETGTDSTLWSNRKWKEELTGLIDRWQAQTDGNTVIFNTAGTGAANYMNSIETNVYLKQLSFKYVCGVPETITGSVQLQLGSMYCKTKATGQAADGKGLMIPEQKQTITITSSDGYNNYTLYFNESQGSQYSCIESYEMKCGPMQPFPVLTMTISIKRLANIAPRLVGDIKAGGTQIKVNACGQQSFIVTKCKTSSNRYKITAYAIEEAYRGIALGTAVSFGSDTENATPYSLIHNLLTNNVIVGKMCSIKFSPAKIYHSYNSTNNHWGTPISEAGTMSFPATTTIWQALSIAAMRLNCQVYFMEGNVYIVDPTIDPTQYDTNMGENAYIEKDVTYLNKVYGESISQKQQRFVNSIVDTPELGDEGTDSLVNNAVIKFNGGTATTNLDNLLTTDMLYCSHESLGDHKSSTFDMSVLKATSKEETSSGSGVYIYKSTDAQAIADAYAKRLCDTQQSVSFEVAERYDDNSWKAYYPAFAQLNTVVDHNTDTLLTNQSSFYYETTSNNVTTKHYFTMPQKLSLSTITRHFPEFTSTYEFGVMAETDLTQTVSQIMNAIG